MDESSASSESAPPRRGCFGCVFTGSLGCGAFLLGSGLAAALFAPRLLGGFAARVVERMVSGEINGQLRIESIELAWTERQRINGIMLLDPAGREVLVMSARIPPVLDLLDDEIFNRRIDLKVARADIVFDENGVSNLLQALGTRGAPANLDLARLRMGDPVEIQQRYGQVDLQVEHANFTDARRPGWSEEANDCTLGLKREEGRVVGELSVASFGTAASRLKASWSTNNVLLEPWRAFEVHLTAESVPLELLDALADADVGLADYLGPYAEVGLDASGNLEEAASSSVSVHSDLADLALRATLEEQVLELALEDADTGLNRLSQADAVAAVISSRLLPAGHRVLANRADAGWEIDTLRLRMPVGEWPRKELDTAGAAEGMSGVLRIKTSEGVHWEAEGMGELLRVTEVDLAVEAPVEQPLAIRLMAVPELAEEGGAPGKLSAQVALEARLADLLGEPGGALTIVPCSTSIDARALPSRALDPFVGEAGLVGDALGPTVAVQLSMDATDDGCALDCELRSADRSLAWQGVLEKNVFRSSDGSRIEGQIDLSRAFHERFLAHIVPWLDELEKDPTSGPVRFSLADFELPLSWDVVDMEGVLWIDLGTVECSYRGGLGELLGSEPGAEPYRGPLGPWTMQIKRGYVHYNTFSVATPRRLTVLGGRLDLEDGGIELNASLPVSAVSHREGVDPSRLGADPNALLPVRLSGAWQDPSVKVAIELKTLFDEVRGGLQDVPGRVRSVFSSIVETLAPGDERTDRD